jgi:hypothetical protein
LGVAPPSWRLRCRLEAGVTTQVGTEPRDEEKGADSFEEINNLAQRRRDSKKEKRTLSFPTFPAFIRKIPKRSTCPKKTWKRGERPGFPGRLARPFRTGPAPWDRNTVRKSLTVATGRWLALFVWPGKFIAVAGWLVAGPQQELARFGEARVRSAFAEKFLGAQGRYFFCHRQIDQLIEGDSLALGGFASLLL